MDAAANALTLDLHPHPVTTEGRAVRSVPVPPGTTLAALVAAEWPAGAPAPCVVRNGDVVPPADWRRCRLRPGDIVQCRAAVGDDDTDPLRTALTIAVVVAAIYVPGSTALWGTGALQAGTLAYAGASAAIMVGGTLVVDAIAPPRLPDAGGLPEAASADPVYALSGIHNRARPYQPMPLVLGRHRLVPDLAAAQYTEFDGDDQYLHALFHFGFGDLDVSELRIGNGLVTSYADVTTQWGDAAGRVGLVAGNVDVQAGDVVDSTSRAVTRILPAGAARVALDFVGRIFEIEDDGDYVSHSVNVRIDVTWPGGAPIARIVTLTSDSATPIRHTESIELSAPPNAAVTVAVRRVTAPSSDNQVLDDVTWQAVRAYETDTGDYTGQNRLGVKIRASGQLTGALDRLSGLVQQKVPIWYPNGPDPNAPDPSAAAWSLPAATSNPAWLFRWFALGVYAAGRLVAGAGLSRDRIDDASIKAWGAWCDANAMRCDFVIQGAMSIHEVLDLIAQCGRASPTWSAGKLGVIWEDAERAPTALISPANILAGTFEVAWAGGQQVDEVAVRYVEPAMDWQYQTLRRKRPGVAHPEATAAITLRGVTVGRAAAEEANLILARQRYQRRRMTWEMGAEALTSLRRGDVVWITHSLIDGGEAGRCAAISADRTRVDLGREVTLSRWTTETTHQNPNWMLFALPDGRLHTASVDETRPPSWQFGDVTTDHVRMIPPLPAPSTNTPAYEPHDVLWRLYTDSAPPVKARIVSVEPLGPHTVRLAAVDESAQFRAAVAAGSRATPASVTTDAALPPAIVSLYAWTRAVEMAGGDAARVTILWEVNGAWDGADLVVTGADDERAYLDAASREYSWIAPRTGAITITLIPRGNPAGAGSLQYTIEGPPRLPLPFSWRGTWASGVRYLPNEAVTYRNISYICLLAHVSSSTRTPSGTTAANTYWDILARPGLDGTDGAGVEYIFARTSDPPPTS